jgi:mono/diheme cytochrome c family protein
MRISTVLVALALAVPTLGFTQDKPDTPLPAGAAGAQPATPADPAASKAIYDQMCAGCHGYRGDGGEGHRGGFSPHIGSLALKEYMSSVPDDYLAMIIRKGGAYMGKIATMPAWEKRLSEAEILGLVVHIRTFVCVKDCAPQ